LAFKVDISDLFLLIRACEQYVSSPVAVDALSIDIFTILKSQQTGLSFSSHVP
jgi:hypothetical protein